MGFFGLLPVRDEADIIGQSLRHALTWADAIYVFDNGSVDDTWEIVQDLSSREKRIKPIRKQAVYFSDTGLRGFLFDYARSAMRDGDWFLRIDADEFHHMPPQQFVKERLRACETIVYHQYYDFRLLQSEADAWERGEETVEDRKKPIAERRKHYTPNEYTEPRLCRYRSTMKWPETTSFPYNAGFLARERLPIRHYPHRDPLQLDRRCRLRNIMMADRGDKSWIRPLIDHWATPEWQKFITPDDFPGLLHWEPGSKLPEVSYTNHLQPPHVRAAQRFVHAALLPILDRRRAGYPGEAILQPIPLEVQQNLERELGSKGAADLSLS